MGRHTRGPFDVANVSPNRVNQYMTCGEAFHRNYVEGIPEQASGSAALFGSVMHAALEKWGPNREQDLLVLVRQAWLSETFEAPAVLEFVSAYQNLSAEIIRAEHQCRIDFEARTGNPSKNIRMAGEWKRHPVSKKLTRFLADWLPRLQDSPWRFTENDPLTALYNESLVLARKYEARNRLRPNTLFAEFGFKVEWNGFALNGYIDTIEPLVVKGKPAYGIVDYKTYRAAPAPAKDWRQRVFYYVAVVDQIERGVLDLDPDLPIYVGMDYVRWTEAWEDESEKKYGYRCQPVEWGTVSQADLDTLLSDLTMYRSGVEAGVFLPAEKGRNVDFCPYPDNCCLKTRGEGTNARILL